MTNSAKVKQIRWFRTEQIMYAKIIKYWYELYVVLYIHILLFLFCCWCTGILLDKTKKPYKSKVFILMCSFKRKAIMEAYMVVKVSTLTTTLKNFKPKMFRYRNKWTHFTLSPFKPFGKQVMHISDLQCPSIHRYHTWQSCSWSRDNQNKTIYFLNDISGQPIKCLYL